MLPPRTDGSIVCSGSGRFFPITHSSMRQGAYRSFAADAVHPMVYSGSWSKNKDGAEFAANCQRDGAGYESLYHHLADHWKVV